MPFEATQVDIRETLEQVQNILTRLEPVLQKLLMSAQGVADKDLPGLVAEALSLLTQAAALLAQTSNKVIPDVLATLQRVRQLTNDLIAAAQHGVTIDLQNVKAKDWNLSGAIRVTPNKETGT